MRWLTWSTRLGGGGAHDLGGGGAGDSGGAGGSGGGGAYDSGGGGGGDSDGQVAQGEWRVQEASQVEVD
jgi:hypothetical protein